MHILNLNNISFVENYEDSIPIIYYMNWLWNYLPTYNEPPIQLNMIDKLAHYKPQRYYRLHNYCLHNNCSHIVHYFNYKNSCLNYTLILFLLFSIVYCYVCRSKKHNNKRTNHYTNI